MICKYILLITFSNASELIFALINSPKYLYLERIILFTKDSEMVISIAI